jgi:hypothetical protein
MPTVLFVALGSEGNREECLALPTELAGANTLLIV